MKKPHITLAHNYWKTIVSSEDTVIDATCGNGHDTLFLAKLNSRRVIGLDLQEEAIKNTKKLLGESHSKVELIQASHVQFPNFLEKGSVGLIVYNLGYLPGGDKSITTLTDTTIESVKNGLELIRPGGAISITCYPGHEEGARESSVLLEFLKTLDSNEWNICHHQWINRPRAPSLLFLIKV